MLTHTIGPVMERTPFVLIFAAVLASSWAGGLGPGLLAAGLGLAWVEFLILNTDSPLDVRLAVVLAVCSAIAVLTAWLTSARRGAVAALRRERDFVTAILDTVGAAVAVVDDGGRIVSFNRACEQTTGFAESEIRGRLIWDAVIPSDDAPRVQAVFEEVRRTRRPVRQENHWLTRDGRRRLFLWSTSAVFDDGKVAYFVRAGIDITERKQAEERFRLMADSLPVLISYVDSDQRYQFNNSMYESWFGEARDAIRGRPMRDVLGEEAYAVARPHAEAALAGRPAAFEAELSYRLAGKRFVHADYVPHVEQGRVCGFFALVHDITAAKQAEQVRTELAAARAAVQARDELIAVVTHDLRAPLSAILLGAEVVRRHPDNVAMVRQGAEAIAASVRNQKLLVDDLLDYARSATGKLQMNFRPTTLDECVQPAIASVRKDVQEKPLDFQVRLDPAITSLEADPERIQQVVWNLLSNAVKFTPSGGRVELLAEPFDGWVRLTVRDTGEGIRPELIPVLFDRFRQGPTGGTGGRRGLGLGLSISKHIVEAHGGRISAESAGEGQGSTFQVELPVRRSS